MDRFDRKLMKLAKTDRPDMPEEAQHRISDTLNSLPDRKSTSYVKNRFLKPLVSATVIAFAAAVIVLPNVNSSIAHAMEQIPVIGTIVKAVTVRNYFYSDDYHELDAEIPHIDAGESSPAADRINDGIDELTGAVINEFYSGVKELGDEGHTSLKIDYDVITDTDDWFTLKLTVYEGSGSSNTYYKYYHIDRLTGEYMSLSDLFDGDEWIQAISNEIKRQMQSRMDEDPNKVYWLDSKYPEWNFTSINADQNFYFSDSGEITIVFDKYEVSPGFMGCPEFSIPEEVYEIYLKQP